MPYSPTTTAISENTNEEESTMGQATNSKGITSMFAEILKELKDIRKQSEDFRQETRQEITSIREAMQKRDEMWEKMSNNLENKLNEECRRQREEIQEMGKKLQKIEDQEEQRAKRERKNNIVIKSLDMTPDNADKDKIKTKSQEILNSIDEEVKAERVSYIGKDSQNRGIVRVTLKSFDDKLTIMKKKAKLKGQDTYIDNDLTKGEREIQNALRQKAREERMKGDTEVKVGYQKILMRGTWVSWEDLQTKNGEKNSEKTQDNHQERTSNKPEN